MVVSARDVCHTKRPAPLAWGFFRHTEVQATSSAATQILARLKRLKENPQ